ncbi:DUF4817 domain-containing protein [Trichonephila clavipes]|nr:DUF4817 domain-containing protein [Trichonephila clavipes]
MHLAYGATNCSGPAAQRLYAERYPMRRIPSHNFFARLHQRLAETGSFERADMVRVRTARTPAVEQNVLQHVERNPRTSTRSVANSVGVSHCSVWRILREQDMHPFHVQRVQTQQPEDYAPRVAFAQWYLGKCATNPFFLMKCCFPMRHPSQGKEFSTRITTIFGRWRIRMQYDVVQHKFYFRSMYGPVLWEIT